MVAIIGAAKTGLDVTRTIVCDVSGKTKILKKKKFKKIFTTLVITTTVNKTESNFTITEANLQLQVMQKNSQDYYNYCN